MSCTVEMSKRTLGELFAIQQQIEDEAICIGVDNYSRTRDKAAKRKDTSNLAPENYLLRKAIIKVSDGISTHLKAHKHGPKEHQAMRNILLKVDPDVLAYLTLQTALNLNGSGRSLLTASFKIGTKIRQHIDYANFKKDSPGYLKAVEKTMNSKSGKYKATVVGMVMDKKGIAREEWHNQNAVSVRVGSYLLDRMMEAVPLFTKVKEHKGERYTYTLSMLPRTQEWIEKAHAQCAEMSPMHMPMVVPPLPWKSLHSGGFLSKAGPYAIPAIRFKYGFDISDRFEDTDMSQVYSCLNALQDTPYKINKRVLDVLRVGAETGMGGLPTPDIKMDLAPTFWSTNAEFERLCEDEPERIKEWKVQRKNTYDKWHRESSARQTLHWQLWLGAKFCEFDSIFFCWNTDWRGRVYPIQQYINPQADGNGKALLEFSKGKALGKHGARWLAIHGANTFGYDKATMDDRVKWVEEHKEYIIDCANNPLDGSRFWCDADSPYMFLAFCFEWKEYLEQGESFVSHLPVNMDGSCSGLQHYSALLKDEVGGRYVNLIPSEKPSDIYAKVAEVSTDLVNRDTEAEEAALWHGKIDRGITKRNTMTWTYSATLYGFTDQLEEEIKKRDIEELRKSGQYFLGDHKLNRKASIYLAKKNLVAISSVVVKAAEAMEYLKSTAKVLAKADVPMEWVTPVGMKVVHHYGKTSRRIIHTLFGGSRIQLSMNEESAKMDAQKNAAGIAPNFIHSLDAAHLVKTINACASEGLSDFMVIHDSFGCHAADLPVLNRILREQFIEMYSDDVLKGFHEQMQKIIPEKLMGKLPNPPGQGRLELESVRESEYFFA